MKYLIIALLLIATPVVALEKEYAVKFCKEQNGVTELRLRSVRIDCVTATHAIEVEFAHKWAESIGQALYYGLVSGRKPGVALIVGPGDQRFLDRLYDVAETYGIEIWKIDK